MASGARSQDFFGQFRGLFKEFRAKRGGRAPPSGFAPAVMHTNMCRDTLLIIPTIKRYVNETAHVVNR